MSTYKPDGFRAVTPYLIVDDADKLTAFLKSVLDAKERYMMRDDTGKVRHASYGFDDSILELASAGEQWKAVPAALHVYVPDTDATYKKAMTTEGATSLYEPADMFYGERSAGVKDINGVSWFFATFQREVPEEELRRKAKETGKG